MIKLKRFILLSIGIYVALFLIVFLPFGVFPGADIVRRCFVYFGLSFYPLLSYTLLIRNKVSFITIHQKELAL